MKKSRISFFWPIVVSLLLFVTSNNLYAADCDSTTIKRVGTNPVTNVAGSSPYMVQLDCSNDLVWPGTLTFFLSQDLGESGLATLMTAYSMGKTVWVRTLGVTAGSIVTVILVND